MLSLPWPEAPPKFWLMVAVPVAVEFVSWATSGRSSNPNSASGILILVSSLRDGADRGGYGSGSIHGEAIEERADRSRTGTNRGPATLPTLTAISAVVEVAQG